MHIANHKSTSRSILCVQENEETRRLAHDIRNSISTISLNLSLIERKSSPEVAQRVKLLEAELVILNEMVNALRETYHYED